MKEFIEIPFGAKDSELGGWEYNIPEGYTASIENGKIIVKKEESDDEKMKKEITELVMQPTWKTEKEFKRRKELCAWLEKQCEQKPTDEEMKILLQTEYEKGRADAIEQKFAWSEEDERMVEDVIEAIDTNYAVSDYNEMVDWLKSLKDRVQPKVGLTQLDKNILEAAIAFVEQNNHFNCWCGVDKHTVLSALYSLRPQNTWKPSDEQIQALEYQVHSTYEGSWQYRASKELLEQLKKL